MQGLAGTKGADYGARDGVDGADGATGADGAPGIKGQQVFYIVECYVNTHTLDPLFHGAIERTGTVLKDLVQLILIVKNTLRTRSLIQMPV